MARFLPLLFKIIGRFSFAKIFFLLVFFLQNIPPPGIMDCCLPCNRSAAHGAQWLDLELIFLLRLTQHRNRRARRERVADASLRPAETFMHACTVQGPRKLNVAVFKGFYDTQTQPVSVSLKNAKSCVRSMYIHKQWLAYFSYTETGTCMRVLHKDEICFTSWTPSLDDRSKLKGQYTDVKSGCGTSVGPSLNPNSIS